MTAHDDIRQVVARYCQLCDDGRFDEWAQLYTDDAHFVVMGRTYEGPPAIQAFIEVGQAPELRGKHLCTNTVIELDDAEQQALVVTDFVFVAPGADRGGAITTIGRYHDVMVRNDRRWRIQRREIVFLGDEPSDEARAG